MFNDHFQKNNDRKSLPRPTGEKLPKAKDKAELLGSDFKKQKKETTLSIQNDNGNAHLKTVRHNILMNEKKKGFHSNDQTYVSNIYEPIQRERDLSMTMSVGQPLKEPPFLARRSSRDEFSQSENLNLDLILNSDLNDDHYSGQTDIESETRVLKQMMADGKLEWKHNFASKNNDYLKKMFIDQGNDQIDHLDHIINDIEIGHIKLHHRTGIIHNRLAQYILRYLKNSTLRKALIALNRLKNLTGRFSTISLGSKFVNCVLKERNLKLLCASFHQLKNNRTLQIQKGCYFSKTFDLFVKLKLMQIKRIFFTKFIMMCSDIPEPQSEVKANTKKIKTAFLLLTKTLQQIRVRNQKSSLSLLTGTKRWKLKSTSFTSKGDPVIAKIANELTSINKKIGNLKSDFQKNEDNVQEIRKSTKKNSKKQIAKIESQVTELLHNNPSKEQFSPHTGKISTPTVNRKSLNEAFKEQNFNLMKFLEKQKVHSYRRNVLKGDTTKLDSQIGRLNCSNDLNYLESDSIAKTHLLKRPDFVGIRDIYFS